MHSPCCCCPTIGFDEAAWGFVTACCSGMSPLINLKTDVSRLAECRVVFAGNNGVCDNAVRFAAGDWPSVKTYIENGGRLFLAAEHSGDFPSANAPAFKCLQDMANLNAFLTALGSAIQYVGGDWNETSPSCGNYTPGAANIGQGLTFPGARFGELSGGQTLFLGYAGGSRNGLGRTAVVVEQLGNGFLFVTGDSNHGIGGCGSPCDFIKRLWEYEDDQIL